MTARFAMLPKEVLGEIVQKISELPFVDALYFDATNKPPATFGWEQPQGFSVTPRERSDIVRKDLFVITQNLFCQKRDELLLS